MRGYTKIFPAGRLARAAIVAAVLTLCAPATPHAAAAVAPVPTVGVVDFYAISPVLWMGGLFPEQFSADDLAAMLARAGVGRIAVVPRADVLRAERTLGWHDSDVLRFARLSDLAHSLHADRLVVGWIRDLSVGMGDGGGGFPRVGRGSGVSAHAILQVQVFDAARGRIISGMPSEGDAIGLVAYLTAEDALHRALGPTVAPTLDALTGEAH